MLKNLVYISIFTTFVVLVWISLTIYTVLNSSTISQSVSTQIIPLKPSFNTTAISGLKQRDQVSVNLNDTISSPSGTVPTPSISLKANPSITPAGTTQIQTSTPSGGIAPATSGGAASNL